MSPATSIDLHTLFVDRGHRRVFRSGAMLFHENDQSTHVYACISGRVRLVVAATGGRELVLDIRLPGEVFGEVSVIDGDGRATSAVAMEPTEVWELAGDDYLSAVLTDASFSLATMRRLCRDLRTAKARICSGETEPVTTRAARLLLELADRFADEATQAPASTVPITQTDLAEWLGATRETTARSLGTLRRAGAISTARRCVTVHDRAVLAMIARPA